MKQQPNPHRRAIGLLLAAAALPATPALAQEAQTSSPPIIDAPPAPQTTAPAEAAPAPQAEAPAPAPVPRMDPIIHRPNVTEDAAEAAEAAPARTAPRRMERAPARPAPRAAAEPRAVARAPVAQPVSETPEAVSAPAPAPLAETPSAPVITDPAPIAETPPAPVADQSQQQQEGRTIWPWLLAGLVALGALALLFRRRRREREELHYAQPYEHIDEPQAVMAAPEPIAPAVGVATAAPATDAGRPWLDLQVRPVRAGVEGEEAVVQFELTVDNQGSAPARDVQVATWMFPAGAQQSEMERMLIDAPGGARLPEVEAGNATRIERAVALSTAGLSEDSLLPVVVAEARYRLSDGSEARTSASFAVGVPWGEELAHFAIDNPSGLHEGVEARPLGEPERV